MKSLKNKIYTGNLVSPCKCGSVDFASLPNRYDIYQIIDGKLELVQSPFTQEETKIFCRECGEELVDADEFVSA